VRGIEDDEVLARGEAGAAEVETGRQCCLAATDDDRAYRAGCLAAQFAPPLGSLTLVVSLLTT
jgi:hypothetical protein